MGVMPDDLHTQRAAGEIEAIQPDLAAIEAYIDAVLGCLEGTIAIRIFPESTDPRVSDKKTHQATLPNDRT
jgi:hypothetical protein